MPRRQHPAWFDPNASYDRDEWKFAIALGRGVGFNSSDQWVNIEGVLQNLWEDLAQDQAWQEIQSAIYFGWWDARRAKLPA